MNILNQKSTKYERSWCLIKFLCEFLNTFSSNCTSNAAGFKTKVGIVTSQIKLVNNSMIKCNLKTLQRIFYV